MAKGDLTWKAPTTNTDGSPFDESQFNGWTLDIGAAQGVSIPMGWKADGIYSFPLPSLQLAEGTYTIAMHTVAKNGAVSAASNTASYTQPKRVPNPPLAVAVA